MSNVLLLFARGAKWTAHQPRDGERHFVVRGIQRSRDADGARARRPDMLLLEAVTTGRVREVPVAEVADAERWLPGWRDVAQAQASRPGSPDGGAQPRLSCSSQRAASTA